MVLNVERRHNRIVLKGRCHHKEARCAVALKPGMDISFNADLDVQPSVLTRANALKHGFKIAKEDGLQSHSIRGTGYQGETYQPDDPVFYYIPNSGDEINILVKDGEVITKGDGLVPEGGGTGLWIKAAGTESRIPFIALETRSPVGENDLVASEYQS